MKRAMKWKMKMYTKMKMKMIKMKEDKDKTNIATEINDDEKGSEDDIRRGQCR